MGGMIDFMRKYVLVFLSLLLAVFMAGCANYGKEKNFDGIQLFYTKAVTESEVDKLGRYLISSGATDGTKKTIQLNKNGNTYEFRMVVKKGLEQDQEYRNLFRLMTLEISQEVFDGKNVDIHLCDDKLETLSVVPMLR